MKDFETSRPESVRRLEDRRFITGAGTFIDDVNLPGQAHAAILRSSRAHAKINAIDTSKAQGAPGVLLVVTGKEWIAAGHGPIPTKSTVRTKRDGSPFNEPKHHCLAVDAVRHVGEPVVLLVAETKAQAEEAIELIDVDYDDLSAVTHQTPALDAGAPQLWADAPGNLCLDYELGNKDAVEAAFAKADHVVTLEVVNNRVTGVPMEPRGVLAAYDKASRHLHAVERSQNIHANREIIADKILNVPAAKVRHVAPDVGGGFGAKNSVYPEPSLLLYATKQIGRPVKWVATRSEAFLSDTHGRDQISTVSLALAKDGTFLALKVETVGNLGAWCGTMGPFTPTQGSARTQGGPYAFAAMHYSAKAAFTNTPQTDPYRGAGRPEASFHIERIVEYAARKLGFDRMELRRKNLIPRAGAALEDADGPLDRLGQLRWTVRSRPEARRLRRISRSVPPKPKRAACAAASPLRPTWNAPAARRRKRPRSRSRRTGPSRWRSAAIPPAWATRPRCRRCWPPSSGFPSSPSVSCRPTRPSPKPAAATAARAGWRSAAMRWPKLPTRSSPRRALLLRIC